MIGLYVIKVLSLKAVYHAYKNILCAKSKSR